MQRSSTTTPRPGAPTPITAQHYILLHRLARILAEIARQQAGRGDER
jgi:hypothetical protein